MIRFFIFLITLLSGLPSFEQNYTTAEGEFMDTTNNHNPDCNDSYGYYYGLGAKYPKSSQTILQEARAFMQKTNNNYSGDGYITFQFPVDCEGHILKKIRVLQTDTTYRAYHFERLLVNELFLYLQTLDNWKKSTIIIGKPFGYYAFISFKIKNGKVINIIP